jgi:hypothetical protein
LRSHRHTVSELTPIRRAASLGRINGSSKSFVIGLLSGRSRPLSHSLELVRFFVEVVIVQHANRNLDFVAIPQTAREGRTPGDSGASSSMAVSMPCLLQRGAEGFNKRMCAARSRSATGPLPERLPPLSGLQLSGLDAVWIGGTSERSEINGLRPFARSCAACAAFIARDSISGGGYPKPRRHVRSLIRAFHSASSIPGSFARISRLIAQSWGYVIRSLFGFQVFHRLHIPTRNARR